MKYPRYIINVITTALVAFPHLAQAQNGFEGLQSTPTLPPSPIVFESPHRPDDLQGAASDINNFACPLPESSHSSLLSTVAICTSHREVMKTDDQREKQCHRCIIGLLVILEPSRSCTRSSILVELNNISHEQSPVYLVVDLTKKGSIL